MALHKDIAKLTLNKAAIADSPELASINDSLEENAENIQKELISNISPHHKAQAASPNAFVVHHHTKHQSEPTVKTENAVFDHPLTTHSPNGNETMPVKGDGNSKHILTKEELQVLFDWVMACKEVDPDTNLVWKHGHKLLPSLSRMTSSDCRKAYYAQVGRFKKNAGLVLKNEEK